MQDEAPDEHGTDRSCASVGPPWVTHQAQRNLVRLDGGSYDPARTAVARLQRAELEATHRERRAHLASLAALRSDRGKGGSELQAQDIARLNRELEDKRQAYNDLRQVLQRLCVFCLSSVLPAHSQAANAQPGRLGSGTTP